MLNETYSAPVDESNEYATLHDDYDDCSHHRVYSAVEEIALIKSSNQSDGGEVPPPLPRRPQGQRPPPARLLQRQSRRDLHQHSSKWDRCSSCGHAFDTESRRRLTESCGHVRCYSCVFGRSACQVCNVESVSPVLERSRRFSSSRSSWRSRILRRRPDQSHVSREESPMRSASSGPCDRRRRSSWDGRLQQRANLHTQFVEWHSISPSSSTTSLVEESLMLRPKMVRPLYFEVPRRDGCRDFVGREWLFGEVQHRLGVQGARGVVLCAQPGGGKTASLLRIVEHSCFRSNQQTMMSSSMCCELGSRVVSFHLCQHSCRSGLGVSSFVANLAAQLMQCPLLAKYHQLMASSLSLQQLFTSDKCNGEPQDVFIKAILQPLNTLERPENDMGLIMLIDGVDVDSSLVSFLAKHIDLFPKWLKLVLTQEGGPDVDVASALGLQVIHLDCWQSDERVHRDLIAYVERRLHPSLASHLLTSQSRRWSGSTEHFLLRFVDHVTRNSEGNMLYLQLMLDLIERSLITPKSTSFNSLPVNLHEVFMLEFNLRFPILSEYKHRIAPLLEICMAAEQPLNTDELFLASQKHPEYKTTSLEVNKLDTQVLDKPSFLANFRQLQGFITRRSDATLTLFHPTLQQWLIKEQIKDDNLTNNKFGCNKFGCNVSLGHQALATFLASRRQLTRSWRPQQTLCVTRHCLKACNQSQALVWSQFSKKDLNEALLECLRRHRCQDDVDVCHLLVEKGADLKFVLDNTHISLDKGLIRELRQHEQPGGSGQRGEHETEEDFSSSNGEKVPKSFNSEDLMKALRLNNVQVAMRLCGQSPQSMLMQHKGMCAMVMAVVMNNCELLMHMVKVGSEEKLEMRENLQNAFVQAAQCGHIPMVRELASRSQLDASSSLHSMSALTAAAESGHVDAVALLLDLGARDGRALLAAARNNESAIVSQLLTKIQPDVLDKRHSRTPLMLACSSSLSTISTLDALLSAGADVLKTDSHGISSLGWACLHGRHDAFLRLIATVSSSLVDKLLNQVDKGGRSLLNLAAYSGQVQLVQELVDRGADIERADCKGVKPLHRAIAKGHVQVVGCLLRRGANIDANTWTTAINQPPIMLQLLDHLVQSGAAHLQSSDPASASRCYAQALHQLRMVLVRSHEYKPWMGQLGSMEVQLVLNLSRCERKLHNYVEAVHLAEMAVNLDPGRHQTRCVLAKALIDSNRLHEALVQVQKAQQMAPDVKEVRTALAMIEDDVLLGLRNLDEKKSYRNSGSDSAVSSSC